jgi:hypothetical protein
MDFFQKNIQVILGEFKKVITFAHAFNEEHLTQF